MSGFRRRVAKLAATSLPLMIQGKTGTGKEYLARFVHQASGVKGRFVAINCAAIPEQLIERELFGYLPGAFTGALAKGRRSLIQDADGGTLFLDEIGDMPLIAQSRLLRVLAEQEITPIGGSLPQKVSFRVLSASHRPLAKMVADGTFREDLFYRLNAATLDMPPLRERDDFDWLLTRLLERHGSRGQPLILSTAARAIVTGHSWPGNIRELDNALAYARALSEGGIVELDDLPESLSRGPHAVRPGDGADELNALLVACGGNISEAARRLGVDRTTLHRRMRRSGLRSIH